VNFLDIQGILETIPDIYDLTPESVRGLRDHMVLALRVGLEAAARDRQNPEPEDDENLKADAVVAMFKRAGDMCPGFNKDMVSSYIRSP